jgi:hypothetical protein
VVSSSKPADRGGGGCVENLPDGGDASGPQHGFPAAMTVRNYRLASKTCFKTSRSTRSPLNFDPKFQPHVDNCSIYIHRKL